MKIAAIKSLGINLVVASALTISLTGCLPFLYTAAVMAPQAIDGLIEHKREAYKDVKITLTRGYTINDLKKIDNVSFLVSEGEGNNFFAPGLRTVFIDNLTREFINEGYEIVERSSIEEIIEEQKFQQSNFSSNKNLAKIGNILGVNGIFKGSVQTGQGFNRGFMGIGADMKSGILSASLNLIDVKTGKIMMIISASYQKPKDPTTVAAHMAKSFKLYSKNL